MSQYLFCYRCAQWKTIIEFNHKLAESDCIQCHKLLNNNDCKIFKKKKYYLLGNNKQIF